MSILRPVFIRLANLVCQVSFCTFLSEVLSREDECLKLLKVGRIDNAAVEILFLHFVQLYFPRLWLHRSVLCDSLALDNL